MRTAPRRLLQRVFSGRRDNKLLDLTMKLMIGMEKPWFGVERSLLALSWRLLWLSFVFGSIISGVDQNQYE